MIQRGQLLRMALKILPAQVDKQTRNIAILLFFGLLLSTSYKLVSFLYPNTAVIEYRLWLNKNHKETITVLWYMYELSGIINRLIWAYALCQVAANIYNKLFKISIVFLCYYISQLILYLWDRNSTPFYNYVIYIAMAEVLYNILKPEKKQGKYVSIN